ncbi:MAG: cysteine methyltransferase, partial [Salegentibacter sp.]
MKKTYLQTPLGIAEICGDENGISEVKITDAEAGSSEEVPELLQPAVHQLSAYFEGNLKEFDLKLNPAGTDFQKKVWAA